MYLHPTKGYRGKNTIQTKSNRRRKYIVYKVRYENKLKKRLTARPQFRMF